MQDSDFISYFIHCSLRERDNENLNEIQVSYIKHCKTLPLGHQREKKEEIFYFKSLFIIIFMGKIICFGLPNDIKNFTFIDHTSERLFSQKFVWWLLNGFKLFSYIVSEIEDTKDYHQFINVRQL